MGPLQHPPSPDSPSCNRFSFARGACLNGAPCLLLILLVCLQVGCGGGAGRDPSAPLSNNRASPAAHLDAMKLLDLPDPSPRYLTELERIVLSPKYLESTRKAAFNRLATRAPERLDAALAPTLSRIQPGDYRAWIVQRIAELDRKQLTKAIIRSWAMPTAYWDRTRARPEPEALAAMYGGEDKVTVALTDTLLTASPTIERNLRARCWELGAAGFTYRSPAPLAEGPGAEGPGGLS